MNRTRRIDWTPASHRGVPVYRFERGGCVMLVGRRARRDGSWGWCVLPKSAPRPPIGGTATGKIEAQYAAEAYAGIHHADPIHPLSSEQNAKALRVEDFLL